MSERTPGPWIQDGWLIRDSRAPKSEPVEMNFVLANAVYVGSDAESLANAAFIVRACNAHDELLAACRRALMVCEELKKIKPHIPTPALDLVQGQLGAAIAKAEGRS